MSHTHSDSNNQTVPTHDDFLSDVNIKVEKFSLSHLSEDNQKEIPITAETEKSTIEKRIPLKLEHPNHFGFIQFNYKGSESDDYFPLNSTVKVKEILLKKSIPERDDSDSGDQQKYIINNIIRHIITKDVYDCCSLCKEAIKHKYTVILQMKLEIIDTNNSFRRFTLYLDDGSGILLCRAITNKDMETIEVLLNFKFDINARSETRERPLYFAVYLKMPDVVDLLISNGADVNATNGLDQVPLHYAAKNNNLRVLNSLLKNQANLNARDKDGQTPLYYAVFNGNENVVDFLISKGADVNATNRLDQVPLHYAVEKYNLNILDSLFRNQVNFNARDKDGRTALYYAVAAGNVDVVDILLKRGADYKLKDRWSLTPFHLAAIHVNLDMIKVFLDNKVDANIVNSRKETLLHAIVETTPTTTSFGVKAADKETYLRIINALVQKGANINFQDEEGNTPLHYAVMKNNRKLIQALLECNAYPAIKNRFGHNVLHLAVTCVENENFIQDILDSNIDIDAVNRDGDTALHMAIQRNDYNIVKLILKKNPNIDRKNRIGDTALHNAVKFEYYDIVDFLLKNRANVDLKDGSEKTALHLAIESDKPPIIILLLESKANVDLKDALGKNALLLAAQFSGIPIEIIESIVNYTNDINAKDERGRTALHHAALNTDDRTLKVLLKAKANVNVNDSEGNTPLHLTMAWENGYVSRFKCMKVLVNYQADVNAVDNDLRTPLHHACWNKHAEAVKYLIKNGADSSMRDKDGRTVFHYACMVKQGLYQELRKDLEDISNILVKEDISVNCVDQFGKTPLHYVVEECDYLFFGLDVPLLEIGADINIEDKDHNTVIDTLLKRIDIFQYSITKPFIEHVIKMREMGMWDREKTLDKIYKAINQYDLQKIQLYERDCRKEVDLMNINIDQSDITYYDFLKKSPHKVVNYTRNQRVINAIPPIVDLILYRIRSTIGGISYLWKFSKMSFT